MKHIQGQNQGWMKSAWCVLRELVGDDAYERYCAHHHQHHARAPIMDRRAFYVKSQQEKWTGLKRCC